MKVLIACEFSGIVRDAFRARGHDAWSCDLLPTESQDSDHHYITYAETILHSHLWDLLIAFPPCTYLCNSGVRWLKNNPERREQMIKAARLFRNFLEAPIGKICVENPIPHKYALDFIGRKYDQIIQPWQFGHGETKATCLWLKGLRKLGTTRLVAGREARIHKMPPSKDRGKLRSITYQGIADAMAAQWG